MLELKKDYYEKLKINTFKKIITYNLNVTGEEVLIIGDKGANGNKLSPMLTNAYSQAAAELGIKHEAIYQEFKTRGSFADKSLVQKLARLPRESVIIMNISNKAGKLGKLGLSFRKFALKQNHRFVSTTSLGTIRSGHFPFVMDCLDINYKEASRKAESIAKKMFGAEEITVTAESGTNISYNVSGMHPRTAVGVYRNPGEGGNLPGAETYIAPNDTNVDGVLVIDGSARLRDKTIIARKPITLIVKKGVITRIVGGEEARLLKNTLVWDAKNAKQPGKTRRIGEFGVGLNKKARIIGSTIIDEKAYGTAHFAIGSNAWFGGNIKTIIHLDQVIRKPFVMIDGKRLKY